MKNTTRLASLLLTMTALASAPAVRADKISAPGQNPSGTIVDIAVEDGRFTTLAAALQCTGLIGVLDGKQQFTVFAPLDSAFGSLNAGNICNEAVVPRADLVRILLYHVARGERFAADVVGSERIRTMNGQFLFPSVDGDDAYVNDAKVLAADIDASNGVIHVIDSVLFPPSN